LAAGRFSTISIEDRSRRNHRFAGPQRLRENDGAEDGERAHLPTSGQVIVDGKPTTEWDLIKLAP
jgi:hypothetical protein